MIARLFAPETKPRRRWDGNSLPVLARPLCPRQACREPLIALPPSVQPALFFHAGYGAAERTSGQVCVRCGWAGTVRVESVNPRSLS